MSVLSSIAFYPTLISLCLLIIAMLFTSYEDNHVTNFLIDNAPYLVINNADTARSILSTLIGGILSLTVFSFSMVMVLLNQASTNFSPRLLPGLISDKKNQMVLGLYLGTILYNIIVLISILPDGDEYTLNGFSVLFGIILGMLCLGAFVFFIHSISNDIQINNIINKIYIQCKDRLHILVEKDRLEGERLTPDDSWSHIYASRIGYYQGVNLAGLKEFAKSHRLKIKVHPYKGQYVLYGTRIVSTNKSLDQEDLDTLADFLVYNNTHQVSDNFVLGIKQITEVGIKAMSPGINDPGTAVITIDYLTELFAMRMKIDDKDLYHDEDKSYTIELETVDFGTLIYQSMAAYRQYCKHDIILMEKMVFMFQYLKKQECKNDKYIDILEEQLNILKVDIQDNIANEMDKEKLLNLLDGSD